MIRTKPPSDRYRDEWDRIFGEKPHWILACGLCGKREAAKGCGHCEQCIREHPNWPHAHESDCPAMKGESCRCPMGNL